MRVQNEARAARSVEVFFAFLKLGSTCFGGPIAHLGYFRDEFVLRRKWLDERAYADLVALCQFLPGPASSQTGFAIGLTRAGYVGGLAAWLGFTAPSAILMTLFAFGAANVAGAAWGQGVLHGLKLVAVAIVAQAVLGMARTLCPDRTRASVAALALVITVFAQGFLGQMVALACGAILGLIFIRSGEEIRAPDTPSPVSRRAAFVFFGLFIIGLLISLAPAAGALGLFGAFYRSGALVFGGGHVVLPLLRSAMVTPGFVSDSAFLAGYGAAQAMPGPLFTFATYLGAVSGVGEGRLVSAAIATLGVFLPGLLVLMAALPFWHAMRSRAGARSVMAGINAVVVGLLAAALYDPVWTSSVGSAGDFAVVAVDFVLLIAWGAPPLAIVALSAVAGLALRLAS